MALTAREWILLPKEEMEARKGELSPEECYKLRMELDMIHFTEQQKADMSKEQKERFIHGKESTQEEKEKFNKTCETMFRKMAEKANTKNQQ